MRTARRMVLRGRVQGVGFRLFVQEMACLEGLAGWVANRPDGAVELSVEGEHESVMRFEAKVRTGPRQAGVESVDVFDEPPTGRAHTFTIRA